MEERKNGLVSEELGDEELEQTSGGLLCPMPQLYTCTSCVWTNIQLPYNWICPACGGSVTRKSLSG